MGIEDQGPPDSRAVRMWSYARRYLPWYGAGGVFLVLTNLAGLAIPREIGQAVELMRKTSGAGTFDTIASNVVEAAQTVILLAIAAGFARVASRITIFNAARYVEYDLRNEVFEKLTRLGPRFFGAIATGDLTSRVANDITFVRVLFALPFLHLINTALAYGIALEKMLALDIGLTLLSLAPYPIILIGVFRIIRAMFEQTKVVQAHLSSISSRVQENLTGISVVKAYSQERREKRKFAALNDEFVVKNMRLALYRGGVFSSMSLMAGIGTLVVLWVGSQRVLDGTLTLGDFVEFNGYVVALAFPTVALGWVFSVWHRGIAAFERVAEVLDAEPAIVSPDNPRPLHRDSRDGAAIEFRGVSFTYPDGETAIRNISLDIAAGSTVALVGRTGSGKTTLLKLLARHYDPDEGAVLVDGVDLRELPLREHRSDLGSVPQGAFLFSMSLGNNIRFGLDALQHDPTVDREVPTKSLRDGSRVESQDQRVEEALELSGLATDVDGFPEGLQTMVGERGITLSGGQKQRVTIARALLVDPRTLVLDDALSSVDTKTEAAILDHLENVMGGRTSILVTHRFNALPRVDKIFVLERGELVESGSHDELLELGGLYATAWARQQIAEALDTDE